MLQKKNNKYINYYIIYYTKAKYIYNFITTVFLTTFAGIQEESPN